MKIFSSIRTRFPGIVLAAVFLIIFSAAAAKAQNLETREIDLKNCIQTYFRQEFIIQTREAFLKTIRSDAGRDFCLKNFESLDFDKNTLLGIELNSGYCRKPVGLKSQAVKVKAEKKIVLQITYAEPGVTCRAVSQYDLWVLVPKIPKNFQVKFEVKAESRSQPEK